jgi:16S rRNA (guanine527-N7)-methyltransferase
MDDQGKLTEYAALVRRYAARLDLVSPGDLDRFEQRHIEDALRLVPLISELPGGPCVDVGSGAGLPGIPLAVATRRHWLLLEPRGRRAAFLEEVVRTLELDCEVVVATAEQASRDPRLAARHICAVARALAPPARALEMMLPLVAPGGTATVFVGRKAIPEGAEEWTPGIATMQVPTRA